MSKRQFIFGLIFASLFGGLVALGGFSLLMKDDSQGGPTLEQRQQVKFSNFTRPDTAGFVVPEGINFVQAASKATPGVVYIRSTYEGSGYSARGGNPFEDRMREFFGDPNNPPRGRQGRSSGSGVIISADGYIVTNNHVIEEADKVEVTLNDNRRYTADVVGTDPTTDLALIKIEEKGLDYLSFGNSDNLQIGQWVLAVGNPFELTSTVTAGIVSAKARNINILRDVNNLQIESFIQTDAAVNPGNSGGALVNLRGEVVGINTAIATPTGTYAGYSFAVPSSLVRKVVDDLAKYGEVQRGLLGISIVDVDADLAERLNIDELKGVYINGVGQNTAADDAGLEQGDIITGVDGIEVTNVAELQEQVALNRPGDDVKVTFIREGRTKTVTATLKNAKGNTDIIVRRSTNEIEGAIFEELSQDELADLKVEGGVRLKELEEGKWKEANIKEGFIITSIDKQQIRTVEDLKRVLARKQGGILVEGKYPSGEEQFYGLGW